MADNRLTLPAAAERPKHSTAPQSRRSVDLTLVPNVPWAWVDEHVYAAIRGCSIKVLQHERCSGTGCPYKKINGTTVRYKLGEIMAFLESQPGGGGRDPVGRGQDRASKNMPPQAVLS